MLCVWRREILGLNVLYLIKLMYHIYSKLAIDLLRNIDSIVKKVWALSRIYILAKIIKKILS